MNNPKILSITYGAYGAVRMMIGVYHAVFLISTGVTLPELALLQVIFSISILLFDFPSSIFADKYSRKYAVIFGVVMTAIFYPLCLQAPNMTALIISEVFYAVGICSISGAIDGWVYHSLDDKESFSHYAHLCQKVSSFGSVIAGVIGIGTIFFSKQYFAGYVVSMIMMIFISIMFLMVPEKKESTYENIKKKTFSQNAKEIIWVFKNSIGGVWYILLICCFCAGIQIIYHFWQPIILSGEKFDQLNNNQMLILMLCHIGAFSAQYLSNSYISKYHVSDKKYNKSIIYFSFSSAILCTALYFLVENNITYIAVLVFSLIHGFINVVPVAANSLFLNKLDQDQTSHISGITSAVSFCGRIFSIAVLSVISFLPDDISPSTYLILPTVSFLICGLVTIRWMSMYFNIKMRKLNE